MIPYRTELWGLMVPRMIDLDWRNMGGYTTLPEEDYRDRRRVYYRNVDRDGFCWLSSDGTPSGYLGHLHVRDHRDMGGLEIVSLQSDGRRRDIVMISAAQWIERCGAGCQVIGGHVHRTNGTAASLYRRLGFSFLPSRDTHREVIRMRMSDFLMHPVIRRMCVRASPAKPIPAEPAETAALVCDHLALI